jgi:hypothetical protein
VLGALPGHEYSNSMEISPKRSEGIGSAVNILLHRREIHLIMMLYKTNAGGRSGPIQTKKTLFYLTEENGNEK